MLCAIALAALAASPSTPWDPILRQAGLKPADLNISSAKWRGGGAYSLKVFDAIWDDWQKLEPFSTDLAHDLLRNAANPTKLVAKAALTLDQPEPKPPSFKRETLVQAILACGGTEASQKQKLDQAAEQVPKPIAQDAAIMLQALQIAAQDRDQAFAWTGLTGKSLHDRLQALSPEALAFATTYDDGGLGPNCLDLMGKTDLGALARGLQALAAAGERLHTGGLPKTPFSFTWQTDLGRIELSGGAKDSHNLAGACLVMDAGGNDSFEGPKDAAGTICAVVDYGPANSFHNCGFALLGIQAIFAQGGHDEFDSDDCGVGGAAFGASLLFERGAQNHFACGSIGEGGAVAGIGILSCLQGQNKFDCKWLAQGFAGPRAFGALVVPKGSNAFDADDVHITNPSPQTAQHNVSMSQGAGFGRRADPGDGHSMAGGVGILAADGGHNSYTCGVFGQGVGYWYAIGALVDFGGHASYQGVWYVQGSAAHYSIGCLLDQGGHSSFLATIAQSQGQGHDYSIGLLRCRGGHDSFASQGSGAFGSGRWNGLGLFAADGPDNTYQGGASESYGFAADHRPAEPCCGLFADLGHPKLINPPKQVADRSIWFFQKTLKPIVLGAGMAH